MPLFAPYLWPYYLFMALFGLAIGSFLNVCIWRIPRNESISRGRSHCVKCNTQLKAYELVPLISYIFLRGKCRTCGTRISPLYPLVELLGSAAFVVAAIVYGFTPLAPVMGLFFCTLIAISFIDLHTHTIPDALVITIAALAVLSYLCPPPQLTIASRLIGSVCVSIPMLVIAIFTHGFGFGDVKLMAAAGLILGWKLTLTAFLMAALLGGIAGAILLITKKANGKTAIAFGPFLCVGLMLSACFGEAIISAYLSLIL
ncbi:MAG: prepilin peptidase [Clostridia bacterium]